VASAGPYANYLHLAPDHTSTSSLNFLQAGCSSWCLTNSVKALKTTAVRLKAYWLCVWCDSEWHCCCTVFFAPYTTITATTTCFSSCFQVNYSSPDLFVFFFYLFQSFENKQHRFLWTRCHSCHSTNRVKVNTAQCNIFHMKPAKLSIPQCKPYSVLTPPQTIYHKFSHKDFMATTPIPLESGGRRRTGEASGWFSMVGINAMSFLQCSEIVGWVTKGHLSWKKHVPLIPKCFLLNQLEKHWVHLD